MTGGCRQEQLAYGPPGLRQMQFLAPIWSIPQVTQQSRLQGLPQLTLWQSGAQAPGALKSGLGCPTMQEPGLLGSGMLVKPPSPVDPPTPPPFEPPVPLALPPEEQATVIKHCTTSAATPRSFKGRLFILSSLVVAGGYRARASSSEAALAAQTTSLIWIPEMGVRRCKPRLTILQGSPKVGPPSGYRLIAVPVFVPGWPG